MPSQRLRPALPMISLSWSMLDTRPTVTMQVSSTCARVCVDGQLFSQEQNILSCKVLTRKASPAPAASTGAERSLFRLLCAVKRRLSLHAEKRLSKGRRITCPGNQCIPNFLKKKTTCSADILRPLPRLYLEVVHQRPNGKSSQGVRIPFFSRHCRVNATRFYSCLNGSINLHPWWRLLPAMRPMTADVLMTSPACMFSVAIIHRFLLPPATSAISADLRSQWRGSDWRFGRWTANASEVVLPRVRKLSSPAWVVSHLDNLLLKGQILFARLIIQPLKVNHSVSLFVASANAMRPNLSFVAQIETTIKKKYK